MTKKKLFAMIFMNGVASLNAATMYVGTCGSPSATTIQIAVTASAAGGTVIICPGTYREQVTIMKNLTVKGVAAGNRDQVVITSPTSGVVTNAADLFNAFPVAAQILVACNATVPNVTVSLSNITVDGSGNGITGCSPDLRGIYYENASGSIANVATRNQVLAAGLIGCQSGEGIFVQSGYGSTTKQHNVSILNNSVHMFQKNGITGDGSMLTVNISGNYIVGQGPTNGAAENGIQVSDGTAGKVVNNTTIDEIWAPDTAGDTGDAASGILIYSSQNIEIANNTVGSTQFGIVTVSNSIDGPADHTNIHDNRVMGTQIFDGIDVCSNSNTVKNNAVFSSTESGIHLDSTCGSTGIKNIVADNVINEGCAGILEGATPNTIGGSEDAANNFFNVASEILTSNVCTAAPLAAASIATNTGNGASGPRFSPVR